MRLIKEIKSKSGEVHFKRWLIWKGKNKEIYIHGIYKADKDKHLHNHPWDIWTIVLWGSYIEKLPRGKQCVRSIFNVRKSKAEEFHAIGYLENPAYTLAIVGPRRNSDWGFLMNGETVQHEEYRKLKRKGK